MVPERSLPGYCTKVLEIHFFSEQCCRLEKAAFTCLSRGITGGGIRDMDVGAAILNHVCSIPCLPVEKAGEIPEQINRQWFFDD